jgi:pre-mRNA-splicing factor 18
MCVPSSFAAHITAYFIHTSATMDFASLMQSQIKSAQPANTDSSGGKKYLKRSELEAHRQEAYQREQEGRERQRLERIAKRRKRDEEEAERNAAREAKRKRLADESRRITEEEELAEEHKRRKRLGLPALERKADSREGTPLKEGEEDIDDEELRTQLKDRGEPRTLFGESHIQRLRRYRALISKALAPKLSDGPIPTALELVEEKDMKVPATVPQDEAGKLYLYRQLGSYFTLLLTEWNMALSRRPAEVKDSLPGKRAHGTYVHALSALKPLFRKLESNTLPPALLPPLTEIVHLAQQRRYVDANDAYLRLSIGKAAWPIGVTMVGIHERSAREKLHETEKGKEGGIAHIMADETTRKMLQGIKRCLSFAQTRWVPEDVGQMMG